MFPLTVILSPGFLSSSPIFQPANTLFSGAVKLFSGSVYSVPFLNSSVFVSFKPLLFGLNVTVYFTSPLFIFKVYLLVFCEFFEIILKFKTFSSLFKVDSSVLNP